MANKLKVQEQEAIANLYRLGWGFAGSPANWASVAIRFGATFGASVLFRKLRCSRRRFSRPRLFRPPAWGMRLTHFRPPAPPRVRTKLTHFRPPGIRGEKASVPITPS